jgi:ATP-dependent DNA helicase RecG
VTAERSSEAYKRLRRTSTRAAGVRRLPADRGVGDLAVASGRGRGERLRRAELRDYRVGLLHGRLAAGRAARADGAVQGAELDVLVATTVIEVGVDVPNATIMIVQEADRFGLAQLHQLAAAWARRRAVVLPAHLAPGEELTDNAQERLQALVDSADGFELAEKDSSCGRGPAPRHAAGRRLRPAVRALAEPTGPLLERARAAAEGLVTYEGPLVEEVERVFGERELAA